MLNYVLKYITKSVINVNTNRIDNVSAVVNWAVNGRAFSISLPARLGFLKNNSNRRPNPCCCRWLFLGYVPYHVYEQGLTFSVAWVIEYFGLDRPPPDGYKTERNVGLGVELLWLACGLREEIYKSELDW